MMMMMMMMKKKKKIQWPFWRCQARLSIVFNRLTDQMNELLDNIIKFVSTIIDLYPLPFELATDLHSLNAYLKAYSPREQPLFASFINRQVNKLECRMREDRRDLPSPIQGPDTHPKSSQDSKEGKYPELRFEFRLEVPCKSTGLKVCGRECLLQKSQGPLSQRSGSSKESEGVKSVRHRFGTRGKHRTEDPSSNQSNKEDASANANLRVNARAYGKEKSEEKSLKFIKSEVELLPKSGGQLTIDRQNSHETCNDCLSRARGRHESYEARPGPSTSLLRIKLKPKPSLNLNRIREGIEQLVVREGIELLVDQMQSAAEEIEQLVGEMEETHLNA